MTDRKPSEMSFTSWIDQQISEAAQRGAFDDLPGAGKPLPKRTESEQEQAWLRDYLRREGISAEALLPEPLRLRKEIARLAEMVCTLRSEQDVREAVAELNHRIAEWRRIPLGPPVFVPLVDEAAMVAKWQAGQQVPARAAPPASQAPSGKARDARDAVAADGAGTRRQRWWGRRRRRPGR